MSQETKEKMFKKVLWLEHMAELQGDGKLFDNRDYEAESDGAYEMLDILGIGREYLNWAIGK